MDDIKLLNIDWSFFNELPVFTRLYSPLAYKHVIVNCLSHFS
ncbi:hypothetical protein ACR30L_06490 [Psychromonas sp. PT13]